MRKKPGPAAAAAATAASRKSGCGRGQGFLGEAKVRPGVPTFGFFGGGALGPISLNQAQTVAQPRATLPPFAKINNLEGKLGSKMTYTLHPNGPEM